MLLIHYPHIQILGTRHAKSDHQLNICGAAWIGDEDQVLAVVGFGEDLMLIGAEHGELDNFLIDSGDFDVGINLVM